jgi:hypothetical protein
LDYYTQYVRKRILIRFGNSPKILKIEDGELRDWRPGGAYKTKPNLILKKNQEFWALTIKLVKLLFFGAENKQVYLFQLVICGGL